MKINFLSSIFLMLLLLGCSDDEINPKVLTESQWQNVIEIQSANPAYEVVYSIAFEADGSAYSEVVFRDLETKDIIGFQEYFTGSYQIIDKKIEVSILERFVNEEGDELYLPKDELTLLQGMDQSREFELRNNNTELHTIMPLLASSRGIIYQRVSK
ncbi:hypothetical protein J2X69_004309 [Algoriphagus sp. 4150]|uniref:hypothetical protein n=1 Tax=Algoriphagus sp. 4150 TaxID=2817756 RepID=UPI00285EDED2|nr:hypothetical protein [Algoriphagus sp. 4150]MDR7131943.1 hypothetical protein [Algoriphagus sp. 4150]